MMTLRSRWLSFAASALAGVTVAGCATIMSPAQMRAQKGSGVRQTIDGPQADVVDVFTDLMQKASYAVTREDDAVFANHSAGVNVALFLYPTDSPEKTDAELYYGSSLLGADFLRKTETDTLKNISDQVELRQLRKKGGSQSVAAAPPAASRKSQPQAEPERSAKRIASDVDHFKVHSETRPDDFALIVGIENYQSLPPADYAENDAASVKEYVQGLGVPEENVIFLTGAKATRTGIAKYLEEWLPRNATPDSRVYFYYSGHGAPDPSTGASYLIPWDGDPSFLQSSAYPVPRLYEKLQALKAKQIIVALDSCFSGAGGRSVIAKGARPLVNVVTAAVPAGSKLSVMTAASADEITGSLDEKGHGVFTYYFLKGLNGEADPDHDGHVTLDKLQAYVQKAVQRAARRDNREQTPQLQSSSPDLRFY
jgi:hypothetical protein